MADLRGQGFRQGQPVKGMRYHLYAIIDIYSRYIVGWTVEAAETGERAKEFIAETIERNGLIPHTVHSDRGTSMTSKTVVQMLIDLGVTRAHSRPKTSNDNPYSEAQSRRSNTAGTTAPTPPASVRPAPGAKDSSGTTTTSTDASESPCTLWHPRTSAAADLVREQRAVTLAGTYARHPERFSRRAAAPGGERAKGLLGFPRHVGVGLTQPVAVAGDQALGGEVEVVSGFGVVGGLASSLGIEENVFMRANGSEPRTGPCMKKVSSRPRTNTTSDEPSRPAIRAHSAR
jgi:Integrase core domain